MQKEYVQMTFRLDPEFHAKCKERSDDAGQTLAEWIRRAMRDKLENETGNKNKGVFTYDITIPYNSKPKTEIERLIDMLDDEDVKYKIREIVAES